MQESFATTKVRPIRKVFIINENDFCTFNMIVKHLMGEIDGIYNLIFESSPIIFESNITEFVNRFDPDIVINYSTLDDIALAKNFKTEVHSAHVSDFNLFRYGSPLYTFTGMPYLLRKYPDLLPTKVYSSSNISTEPNDLFFGLNYGIMNKKDYVRLKRSQSIFKDILIECAHKKVNIEDTIFDDQRKFCFITNQIGSGHSTSGSVYAINHNLPNLFEKDNFCFISKANDLNNILFFWNERVAFNHSKTAWLPIELLDAEINIIKDNTTLICTNETDAQTLETKYSNNKIIIIKEYYFNVESERWSDFEHDQNIIFDKGKVVVRHPNEKTFSDTGFGGCYVLEIKGNNTFNYPKNYFFDELLRAKNIDKKMFPTYFTRFSNKGISRYVQHFSPFDTSGITDAFNIPDFSSTLRFHFSKIGYTLKETPKTFILGQVINLLKGLNNCKLLCDRKIYTFINKITPHNRTESIIKSHLPELLNSPHKDTIASYLGKLNDIGDVVIPSKILTIENILPEISDNEIKNKESKKEDAILKVQQLYNNKILLRGKNFTCEHCTASLWFALEDFSRINYCNECGNSINIPITTSNKSTGDHFKINHLVSRAVDQGQLATLLLIHYLYSQSTSIPYIANYEIYDDSKLLSDIDVCVKLGNKLGLCECKSKQSFSEKQIDELVFIANKINCDFILLSCLLSKNDDGISRNIDYIKEKNINIPVFIITDEELFSPTPKRLYSYFEVNHRTNKFHSGPILI